MTPIFFLLCSILFSVDSTKLENNGYTGVVVAINDYISQDHEKTLIANIKTMFTDASEFLYLATHKRAYFKEVVILVPGTWSKQEYMELAGTESFTMADVRISDPDRTRLNLSFTQSGTTCGEQGEYIHVNTEHLLNGPHDAVLYGPPGRWLTKHWAQYRYGIFEEHGLIGNDVFRTFYITDSGHVRASSCSNSMTLSMGLKMNFVTKKPCTELEDDGVDSKDCYYDASDDNIKTSIAFAHYHPKVKHFCGSSDEFKHDTKPPTPHNVHCNKRSTWEVIMDHADFKNNNNPPREGVNTKPNFRVVIPSEKRFVLVLDVSASMNGSRINMVRQVLTNFIDILVPKASTLGIVTFSKNATILQPMTKLKSDADRRAVIEKLSSLTGQSSTCIACGLLEAIQVLKHDSEDPVGAKIVLATDGNENEKPRIRDVLGILQKESVRVYTIAYGGYADESLEKVATVTNGKTCFVQQNQETSRSDFESCLFQALADGDLNTHKLVKRSYTVNKNKRITGTFNTDSKFIDLKLSLMYDVANSLTNITLLAPNKSALYYDYNQPTSSRKDNFVSVPLSGDELGLWQYNAYFSRISQNVGVSVVGICNNKKTIRLEGWLNLKNRMVTAGKDQVAIFARIYAGSEPITKAVVHAQITLPDGNRMEQRLWDNGTEPDTLKSDGVYSRFFINFHGKGRYGIILAAKGLITSSENKEIPFERFFVIGSFSVLNDYYVDNPDLIPPNAVYDLNVKQFNIKTNEVTLNWTAPGDNFDIGQATKYEIKYSSNPSILRLYFDDVQFEISSTDVVAGSLIPQPGGVEDTITIRIPIIPPDSDNKLLYIALKTVDDNNNTAKISNIVKIPTGITTLPICKKVGTRYPEPNNCSLFYICTAVGYIPEKMLCAPGTGFNPKLGICDWPLSASCRP